jgi:hypothetical protein
VEQDKSAEDIVVAGFPEAEVRRVAGMVGHNKYKRRQAPPSVKITPAPLAATGAVCARFVERSRPRDAPTKQLLINVNLVVGGQAVAPRLNY